MSERSSVNGVDVSSWQGGVDYGAIAKSGAEFVIIRTGYGETIDREFKKHVEGCLAAGLPYGYYHYSYARDEKQARREAAACVKAISRYPAPSYPVFFDAEESGIAKALGRGAMTDVALAFVEAVEDAGYPSGIYANPSWLENEYEKSRLIGNVDIWLAHWTWSPDKPSPYDYAQRMWQWGTVSIGGYSVDADICYVDYPALTSMWYAERSGKSLERVAREVLGGDWGNGAERAEKLKAAGYDYAAVQAEVNRLLAAKSKKSVDEIVVEVVRGLWGYGSERKERLEAAGYDYGEVQKRVNELISG